MVPELFHGIQSFALVNFVNSQITPVNGFGFPQIERDLQAQPQGEKDHAEQQRRATLCSAASDFVC